VVAVVHNAVGLTAAAVEAPLYLAFAALGYELLARRPSRLGYASAASSSSRLVRFQRRSMNTASQIESS
jgi:hypothetical protein